jgi:UDP-galactose transporter B1
LCLCTQGLFSFTGTGGEKFTATLFFLLVQCLTNTLVAGAALLALGVGSSASGSPIRPAGGSDLSPSPPALDYVTAGVSYISAMLCSTEALKHVTLPMQALGKSCKMVPVMLFGFLIRGKRYSLRETLAVLLITAGISVFQQKKSSAGGAGAAGREEGHASYGLVLLFLSLVLDGVTGACQDRMR